MNKKKSAEALLKNLYIKEDSAILPRQKKLLETLIVIISILSIIIAILPIITNTDSLQNNLKIFILAVTFIVISTIAFFISRKGYYYLSAVTTVTIMTLIIYIISVTIDIDLFPFLAIPMLVGSMLLPISTQYLQAVIFLGIPFTLPMFTELGFLQVLSGLFTFVLLSEITIILSRTHLSMLEEDRKRELVETKDWLFTTLSSIGDAVIATDKTAKIKFINSVAAELTGWKEKESIGKDLTTIFNIINEETKEKVENPVTKVLSEGEVVGLANHTLLINRKGKEIPIKDSGAPIKDEYGNVNGAVLVFRDISDEREKEEELNIKLQESEIFMRSAVGREKRIEELKKQVKKLEKQISENKNPK